MVSRAIAFLKAIFFPRRDKWCIHRDGEVLECKSRPFQMLLGKTKFLAIFLLFGCAIPQRETLYPGIRSSLRVIEAEQAEVNDICRRNNVGVLVPMRKDDDSPLLPHENIGGCFREWDNTIFIIHGAPGCIWRHELCHAAGLSKQQCAEVECE